MSKGEAIAIHCRAGIGRSAIIAGAILSLHGLQLPKILERLTKARGLPVPETQDQMEWLKSFGK
jgi:protein-tyrosine phosphatase